MMKGDMPLMDHIFDENQPIYFQIKNRICAAILRGVYQPGGKLPGVVDMAMQYKVNHNTIQRVYQELIREGIAVAKRGEGTFVTGDVGVIQGVKGQLQGYYLETFVQQMSALGYDREDLAQTVQAYVSHHRQAESKEE